MIVGFHQQLGLISLLKILCRLQKPLPLLFLIFEHFIIIEHSSLLDGVLLRTVVLATCDGLRVGSCFKQCAVIEVLAVTAGVVVLLWNLDIHLPFWLDDRRFIFFILHLAR